MATCLEFLSLFLSLLFKLFGLSKHNFFTAVVLHLDSMVQDKPLYDFLEHQDHCKADFLLISNKYNISKVAVFLVSCWSCFAFYRIYFSQDSAPPLKKMLLYFMFKCKWVHNLHTNTMQT